MLILLLCNYNNDQLNYLIVCPDTQVLSKLASSSPSAVVAMHARMGVGNDEYFEK